MQQPKTRRILSNAEARQMLKEGIDLVANAVGVTLGPLGRNVVIANGDYMPITTKDGVTVARSINPSNREVAIGARIIQGVAAKTVRDSGDGTTSATILAQFIINEGMKAVEAGANPIRLKAGIESAVKEVVQFLKDSSINDIGDDFEKLKHVASIAANNDEEIGQLIAEAFHKIGKNGFVTAKDSPNNKTTVEVVMGTQINSGYLSPYFINNTHGTCVLENPFIVIVDSLVNRHDKGLVALAELIKKSGDRPLLVIADDVTNEGLQFLVSNHMKKSFISCAIKAPWVGQRKMDEYEDIAVLTGASVISSSKNNKLESAHIRMLGQAEKVIISKDTTTIVGGKGEKGLVAERTSMIENLIAEEKDETKLDVYRQRLGKINGGIGVIYVGGNSPMEIEEKRDRIDDSIRATKSAIEEGVVEGGGMALLRCQRNFFGFNEKDDSFKNGVMIIYNALSVQLKRICYNAGIEIDDVTSTLGGNRTGGGLDPIGYNAKTGEYGDMFKMGVIDPTKVVRCALENAASVACMVLISDCLIIDEEVY